MIRHVYTRLDRTAQVVICRYRRVEGRWSRTKSQTRPDVLSCRNRIDDGLEQVLASTNGIGVHLNSRYTREACFRRQYHAVIGVVTPMLHLTSLGICMINLDSFSCKENCGRR